MGLGPRASYIHSTGFPTQPHSRFMNFYFYTHHYSLAGGNMNQNDSVLSPHPRKMPESKRPETPMLAAMGGKGPPILSLGMGHTCPASMENMGLSRESRRRTRLGPSNSMPSPQTQKYQLTAHVCFPLSVSNPPPPRPRLQTTHC